MTLAHPRHTVEFFAHQSQSEELLGGKRTPFQWPTFVVRPGAPAVLSSVTNETATAGSRGGAVLRLVVALELWEDASLSVRSAESGTLVGYATMDHSDAFEIIELPLTSEESRLLAMEGLSIETNASEGVRFFDARGEVPPELRPRSTAAVVPSSPVSSRISGMLAVMRSFASLQQFGWKEGCVLDALWSLECAFPDQGHRSAIVRHLALFRSPTGSLEYEDPWGRPVQGFIHGIEAALPFAIVAQLDSDDVLVGQFLDFVGSTRGDDGLIVDDQMISAEGCYTIAYPLAVIARLRDSPELFELALQQLSERAKQLVVDEDLYLRSEPEGRTFKNWARAYSWFLLGCAKTLEQIPRALWPEKTLAAIRHVADLAVARQLPDGTWRSFLNDPTTGTDTSGSAGIAAGLAVASRLGVVEASGAAARAYVGLQRWLTADGLLAGSTQANKGGERLQRRQYRIISQMGTGLFALLYVESTRSP